VLYSNLKLSLGKLSHFSDIWWAFGALMFLVEPKERGRESSMHCKDTVPKIGKIIPEKKLRGLSPNF
jgi:hypothetical protein